MDNVEDSLKTVVRVFRRECHRILESERTTIRGSDGMLIALQLAMAQINKQESGEFSVDLSDVLRSWKCLLLDKLNLSCEATIRPENYELVQREYECFMKRTNTVDLIDVYFMFKKLRVDSDPDENLLTPTQLFQFISGNMVHSEETSLLPSCPSTPSSQPRPCPLQVRRVVKRIFCSYFDLLVNSKNDLALAHVLDAPDRNLGRTAFTDLKHAAHRSETSLFLAVTSFVRAIELGGKGYAPPESDPLRKHLKGFLNFVHFTDQLEEVLGEATDPSLAGTRLVSSLRAALMKGRRSGDAVSAVVDDMAGALKERISQIHHAQRELAIKMGISPARPKAHAINHATALGGRDVVKVLIMLLDEEALTPPFRNKAALLMDDQAILNSCEGTSLLTLYQSPEVAASSPKPLWNRVQEQQPKTKVRERVIRSQFACTYLDDGLPLSRVLEFPSTSQLPTCAHPAPKRHGTSNKDQRDSKLDHLLTESSIGGGHSAHDVSEGGGVPHSRATLGHRCGNVPSQDGTIVPRNPGPQPAKKTLKRKQMDLADRNLENEQPPQKKASIKAPSAAPGKKAASKAPVKKLISGQGRLTSFFRF
ncbi:PCNA-interacting partner isoform X2 [Denticeps clupeoides]|uniref:PCNA-interacting partner isoform X2 n=1 Tax=Denticeps clupeoides TaxID=299321 RepID=UPI0010A52693|nr:PCNA-interacting partner isoform X2 [Denticeps clupeoides]